MSPLRSELLATTDWLAGAAGRPELRVVDVRWRPDGTAREVHARGHIPGAAHIDWSADLVERDGESGSLLLAGPERVAAALGHAGVGEGTTLVVYDDTASLIAARVWWSLRAHGYDSCRILDGGYGAWIGEGRPVSAVDPSPTPVTFVPRVAPRQRVLTADVRALLGSHEALLVDARAPAEYLGHEGDARRLGHIPGAVNVPVAATTLPGNGRFRDEDALRAILRGANVTRNRRLICYDGSGVAAAKLAFVLSLLGYEDVAVYDGGWGDWGGHLDLPVER